MMEPNSLCGHRNISMLMDLYELTMTNGFYLLGKGGKPTVYDMFYRRNPDNGGFTIFAGLEQMLEFIECFHFTERDIDYLRNLGLFADKFLDYLRDFRFTGDIYAFPEGTVAYPDEPIVTVVAPLIEAQIIETAMLSQFNHQSLIATKANRIVRAARGKEVADMGARRAHNADAAIYGARAAYIGGVSATATVISGEMFGIPVTGTMAHSWIMSFESEYEAFKAYAEIYGSRSVFLVDTYNTLESGVPDAIRVFHDVLEPRGERLRGIRIDSGDIASLSKKARKMLDEAGMTDCLIVASNSLDEGTIGSILSQGGCIDIFGVGERLITAKSDSTFGGVYKLTTIDRNGIWEPKIKISDNVTKITNPGLKSVYRVFDSEGLSVGELITHHSDSLPDLSKLECVSPDKPWQHISLAGCRLRPLQVKVMERGQRLYPKAQLSDIRDYVKRQLATEVRPEEQRFYNPDIHPLLMSRAYYDMKVALLRNIEEESRHNNSSR